MKKNKNANAVKPFYKKWWFGTSIALALVLILVLVTTLDYNIICLGLKLGCKPGKMETPDNYVTITENTQFLAENLDYASKYENDTMDIIAPKNVSEELPILVYIHGGYYVGGDKDSAEVYCRIIANGGFIVANVNYALAPKAKYPTQAKQINEAIAFLVKNAAKYHIDADQIFISGDSAGGHLSAQLGAFYTNKELQSKIGATPAVPASSIKGVLLLCGFYNGETVRDSKFPFLNTAMWAWTDVRNYESYSRWEEISVVNYITSNYPATYITCGSDDPFYTQAEEMVGVLAKNKVETVDYLPKSKVNKLEHEFQREFSLDEANTAMEMALKFMNDNSVKVENVIYADFNFSDGGTVKVKLYKNYAPITVENFIKYVEAGFYTDTIIHRVLSGQVVQGGGFYMNGNTKIEKSAPYAPIVGEFANNGYSYNVLSHQAGVISMARTSVKDSATSQFFFCTTDCSYYDGDYAAFGKIVEGLDYMIDLSNMSVTGDNPNRLVKLTSVTIEK